MRLIWAYISALLLTGCTVVLVHPFAPCRDPETVLNLGVVKVLSCAPPCS